MTTHSVPASSTQTVLCGVTWTYSAGLPRRLQPSFPRFTIEREIRAIFSPASREQLGDGRVVNLSVGARAYVLASLEKLVLKSVHRGDLGACGDLVE
jgi:hypothetical protein